MAKKSTTLKNVVITVDSHHHEKRKLAGVAQNLKKAGLKAGNTLDALGLITGSVDAEKVQSLKSIRGVNAVEEQADYHLAPPDAEVQ